MKSQTNNKITKANKYPLSYKEINNISTNYLYIQIKNGLNHSQNKKFKTANQSQKFKIKQKYFIKSIFNRTHNNKFRNKAKA